MIMNLHLPVLVHSFVPTTKTFMKNNPLHATTDDDDKNENNNNNKPVWFYTSSKNGYSMPSDIDGNTNNNNDIGYNAFLDKSHFFHRLQSKSNTNVDPEFNEDGYADMQRNKRSVFKRFFKRMIRKFRKPNTEVGTLILVRHGESQWNANKTFTGWADPDLTDQGTREVEHAARLLMEGGYKIDVVFTSRLKRAIRSSWIILQELDKVYLPVFKSWRLNERMYGALTGLSKKETAEQLGHEVVQEWRGSLTSRPPALTVRDEHWPGRDRKYADLTIDQIPMTESLLDCMERTCPLWEKKIKYELQRGRNVLVVAHANTLRGLVKTIDNIGDEEIQEVAIPTGIPIVYKFDASMQSIPPTSEERTVSQIHMNGLFLEKPGLLKEALKREKEWAKAVPGYDSTMGRNKRPMAPLERSLYKLNAVRELGDWAEEFVDHDAELEDDGSDGNMGKPMQLMKAKLEEAIEAPAGIVEDVIALAKEKQAELVYDPDTNGENHVKQTQPVYDPLANAVPTMYSQPCVTSMPSSALVEQLGPTPIRRDSVIVIIRHGKTEHNKLGLFTGWEDAPLAKDGIVEAKEAGKLLKLHGFEFDVVYTSWLSRAIETAWYVMDSMDALWLPIIKTWRLNERMYGELTGLSKKMVRQRHGDEQFMAWRRGYDVKPPHVSSFSPNYPGNDPRYQKYLKDVRYSFRESLIRTIEQGQPTLQRKLPKTESLKDCMDRTIPYFVERIQAEAVDQGKRVLISSSENAIRGLLMHLCDIPEEQITGLEIPNGLPLIFDVKSKCVKLLDDGTGRDPLEVYNFGKAAPYLFRPCENEDGSPDEECDIHFDATPGTISADDMAMLESITKKPDWVVANSAK
eukprot:CAMPEP_0119572694 /NCGR_PEP_ID=MMETSP1352-20130426/44750_1 /TAXON_ID=265584 /ORGANISM="Stauroneis constricta, Strain CCMP1120" /LENGTH=855 /DNA_ID=CAMNT_0007622381 /DNA_START=144 /DNA_END=2711 /DNA_ORIENTATION=-